MLLAAAGAVCSYSVPALATANTFYILQKDVRFIQTGASTNTSDGFTFLGRATPDDGVGPIADTSGTLTFPSPSPLTPQTLSPSGAELDYSSGKIDQTTFQTDYPDGIYKFDLNTEGGSVDSTIAAQPSAIPMLTPTSFNALQGMDATQPITVSFNSFTNPDADALIFFAVVDSSGNTILFDGLQPNVTQDTIAANALQPGGQYSYFLFFSNANVIGNGEVLFENRTKGVFNTQAVPEPGSAAIGLLGLGLLAKRRRKAIA